MAARMAANRLQYPCNGCGVLGHWKRDDQCKPADVAKYIKKKMAEQAKRDEEEEEGEDTGKNIYSDYLLYDKKILQIFILHKFYLAMTGANFGYAFLA